MRSIVLAISAAALAASVAAANPASTPPPAQSSAAPSVHGHARLHMLTPEERMLYREQLHGASWRSLTRDERCAKKRQMKQQLASLSPAAMEKLKAQLDAEWSKLPAAKKQRIEQRIANRHEKRAEGASAPMGHRGGGGGCRAEDL